jgi:hypothetical protein
MWEKGMNGFLGAKRDWVYCNVSMSKNEGDLGYRSKKE